MRRGEMQRATVPAIDIPELSVADANGSLQHGLEHRFKIARRAADRLEHVGRGRLLLKRFRQFPRALLLRLEQPRVFDGDDSLVGEGGQERDVLVVKRLDGCPAYNKYPDRITLAEKR